MKVLLLICAVFVSFLGLAQHRKFRAPLWTTHDANVDIVGASIGFVPRDLTSDTSLVRPMG